MGDIRRFDRHANMGGETRGQILDYTNYPIIYNDMDKYERINEALKKEGFRKSTFSNYLYGLFDGYDYSDTDTFKEQMAIIKKADPEFHKKISAIYEEIRSYPEVKYAKGSTVKGGGVGDTIADRYARLTKTEAKRLDELSKKVRINEQTDEEDIEWDKLVHKYRGWDYKGYGKFAKGTTIGKEKVWQVVYYGEKHLKQRGSSKGSYKTWVVATSREEAIQKVKSDDDEFAELKSAKPTTLDVERHKFGNGGALEGWGGTSESSQDGMLIGGTNAELTSNQYGKGGGVKRTKTAEEIYEEEQQNAMFNSEYAKGGVIPYALRKRVENVKNKFGIEITKEMGLQAYHWNTEEGMGGSSVGLKLYKAKNKRDSQTIGDTAIDLGKYYSEYGNGGMTSGWCYSIGGL